MNVLIACEFSGVVREAFRRRGHNAWSCDLLPALDKSEYHIQGDALDAAYNLSPPWDLMIAHPPCTHLAASGARWWKDKQREQQEAAIFVLSLRAAPIPKIAIENPVGAPSRIWRKPDQIIQPWQFGDDASKATCLWLQDLPKLEPTAHVLPRIIDGKPRWANQTDSGQNRLGPSEDRGLLRSITYQGIAEAMAEQWSL